MERLGEEIGEMSISAVLQAGAQMSQRARIPNVYAVPPRYAGDDRAHDALRRALSAKRAAACETPLRHSSGEVSESATETLHDLVGASRWIRDNLGRDPSARREESDSAEAKAPSGTRGPGGPACSRSGRRLLCAEAQKTEDEISGLALFRPDSREGGFRPPRVHAEPTRQSPSQREEAPRVTQTGRAAERERACRRPQPNWMELKAAELTEQSIVELTESLLSQCEKAVPACVH